MVERASSSGAIGYMESLLVPGSESPERTQPLEPRLHPPRHKECIARYTPGGAPESVGLLTTVLGADPGGRCIGPPRTPRPRPSRVARARRRRPRSTPAGYP